MSSVPNTAVRLYKWLKAMELRPIVMQISPEAGEDSVL